MAALNYSVTALLIGHWCSLAAQMAPFRQGPQVFSRLGLSGPGSPVAADFNGDGKVDLAVANRGSWEILVLPGQGDGAFGDPLPTKLMAAPIALVPADFDRDGHLDLAVVSSRELAIYLGDGGGKFRRAASVAAVVEGRVLAADFNQDGFPDLAAADPRIVCVWLNRADGSLEPVVTDYMGGFVGLQQSTGAVMAADVNNDGLLDLIVSDTYMFGTAVAWFEGKGDGTFLFESHYATSFEGQDEVIAADFNQDGLVDLAVKNYLGISVLLGARNGFEAESRVVTRDYYSRMLCADFNRDRIPDFFVEGRLPSGSPGAAIFWGKGDGTFRVEPRPIIGLPEEAVAADFNGDSRLDLAGVGGDRDSLTVILELADENPRSSSIASGRRYAALEVQDFNLDGLPDVASIDLISNELTFLFSQPDGSLREAVVSLPLRPARMASGDFNGDGIPDLTFSSQKTVLVLLCPGVASFGSPIFTEAPGTITQMVAGDFNNDRSTDLVVSIGFGNWMLVGNGDGSFRAVEIPNVAAYVIGMAAADFNRDGCLDLVRLNASGPAAWLMGRCDGTFSAPNFSADHVRIWTSLLATGDFDGDGNLDFAAGGRIYEGTARDMVLVWSGASDGRINGPAKIEINSGGVLAGDFNGDHKTDLLTLSGSLLLSRGSVFEPAVPIKPGAWLSGAVADFDRDGSPDIVLGGYSRLSVLLNTAK